VGAEVHFKALALIRGSKWESLDLAGQEEMASAALSELGHLGPEAHGFGFGKGGESLDSSRRKEMVSAAMGKLGLPVSRGLYCDSLSPSARKGLKSEGRSERKRHSLLHKPNDALSLSRLSTE